LNPHLPRSRQSDRHTFRYVCTRHNRQWDPRMRYCGFVYRAHDHSKAMPIDGMMLMQVYTEKVGGKNPILKARDRAATTAERDWIVANTSLRCAQANPNGGLCEKSQEREGEKSPARTLPNNRQAVYHKTTTTTRGARDGSKNLQECLFATRVQKCHCRS